MATTTKRRAGGGALGLIAAVAVAVLVLSATGRGPANQESGHSVIFYGEIVHTNDKAYKGDHGGGRAKWRHNARSDDEYWSSTAGSWVRVEAPYKEGDHVELTLTLNGLPEGVHVRCMIRHPGGQLDKRLSKPTGKDGSATVTCIHPLL